MTNHLLAYGMLAGFGAASFLVLVALYIYGALALMTIAKRLKHETPWLAWIPIANFYLVTQLAGQSGLWTLILLAGFIPFVGSLAVLIVTVWLFWLVIEKLKRPGWWSLLLLIPFVNLIVLGVLAWSKK